MQFVVVKTAGDPAMLARELRSIVTAASARATLDQVMTMDRRLMASLAMIVAAALLLWRPSPS